MPFITSQGDIADTCQKATNAIVQFASEHEQDDCSNHSDTAEHRILDEIQRLEIWASQHSVREGRLDHKLREASLLQERVLSLLRNLLEIAAARGDTQPKPDSHLRGKPRVSQADAREEAPLRPQLSISIRQDRKGPRSVTSQSSSGIDTNISLGDSVPDSPVAQIHDTITLLLELGPSLLEPAPHDRLESAASADAARFDLDHAQAKFPKAEHDFIKRVGLANWERRQSLRSLRLKSSYKNDFGHVLTRQESQEDADDNGDVEHNDSEESSSHEDSASADSSSVASLTTPSHFSKAETIESTSGSIFSGPGTRSTPGTELSVPQDRYLSTGTSTKQSYKVPPPPQPNGNYSGETFLCPYCYRRVSGIESSMQWRKHVFEDLEPYMCTYETCTSMGKTYGDKSIWWQHEIDRHRAIRSWKCSPCEKRDQESVFDSAESFDYHIKEYHPTIATPAQLWSIRELCQKKVGISNPHSHCPFCQEPFQAESHTSSRARERGIRKHISKHFEQMALFVAFPAGQMILRDDDTFIDDSDSDAEFKTEIESIFSEDRRPSKLEVRQANVNRFMADQNGTEAPVVSNSTRHSQEKKIVHINAAQPLFPVRILLHPPNEHFYGRQDLITDADKLLRSPGSICIFHGVGGIGKTLAAIEYIYRNQDHYDAIFWLQADTAPSLSDSYMQMGVALGLISTSDDHLQAMERGRNWLQDTEKQWLLVFDNALAWDQISPFMPNSLQQTNGSILITTQLKDIVRDSKNVHKMRLEPLNQEAGSVMLLKYLGKDIELDAEKHLAKEISTFVGGLPIAIAHVAGYADASSYSLEELIEVFREWRKRTGIATDEADDLPVSFRQAAFSYDETLAMVWNVTLRDLSKDAQDVMHILAYLNSEAVPQSMLFSIHEEKSLHFLDSREKIRLRRIRESLIRRRLVHSKEVDGEWCFSVHRSLQRGIRETLSQDLEKQQLVFDQAVALLREVFPRSNPLQQPMPEQWSEYQRLLPHLHALHDVYNKFKPQISGSIDFAQLLSDAGMDQFERGITKEGLLLLRTAEEVLDSVSHDDHQVLRADIHAMIGIMYDNTGIETRAEGLRRRKIALDIRKKIVDNSSSSTRNDEILLYNSWMEYAISLLHYHRFEEAEPVIESCLKKYREWGRESDIPFEYAKYYNKIALVRMYQERFDEAIKMAKRGAYLMSKTGYVLFETRFRFDLACIILQSGDVDLALKVHREIFDSRLEKLGQTNELTLHSRYAIGAIYEIKGQYEEAEFWFRKALDQRRGVSSWPDEAFSRAQFHLARVLQLQGQPEDAKVARSLRDRSLEVLYRLLPLDHPEELKDITDEGVLFDHMLTISGARFTGQGLLRYFAKPGV